MSMNPETPQIIAMRTGGRILHQILKELTLQIKPGQTGIILNELAEKSIHAVGARPAFKNYQGFPATLCVSINDQIVHGIPSSYQFQSGDIVSLDCGLLYDNYFTDAAVSALVTNDGVRTVDDILSKTSNTPQETLIQTAYECLEEGISRVREGVRTGDIGNAIQVLAESRRLGVVRDLVGHGVGRSVHEEPSVPNFGRSGEGSRLHAGQTIAIEPMLTYGDWHIKTDSDGWTVRTIDGSLAVHFEHTVLVLESGFEILT